MRCRTLARELRRRGAEVCFLCRRQPGDLINLLKDEFQVLALHEQHLAACDGLKGRDLYGAWLGCSQDQDAADCLQVLTEAGFTSACWLVVDHYGLDACWEEQLLVGLSGSDSAPKLLVIDDLADRLHQADLLLDQNFFGEVTEQRYQALVPTNCLQLLGPYYSLLGPEYAQLRPLVPPRNQFRRVLVFFGGVDSSNLTGRALEALMNPLLSELAVDVVLGLQSPHHKEVAELVARRPATALHGHLHSLAGLMARADLAIGAGGATTWERACLGLPSLVVVSAVNQLPFAQALDDAGHLRLLGEEASVTTDQIRFALLSLISKKGTSEAATGLTDGWGAPRLAIAMLGSQQKISLRPATDVDESLLAHWSNDLQVRANSFMQELIEQPDYNNWLQKSLVNSNCLLLIVTTADGCPIGQFCLDRKPSSENGVASQAQLQLLLDRCALGHGLASELLRSGLQLMEQHWGPDSNSVADVLSGNTASDVCFASAGFFPESEFVSNPFSAKGSDSLMLAPSRITLLSDRDSWLNAFLPELVIALWQRGHAVRWIHTPEELRTGDVCLLLSCGRLLKAEQLALHTNNLVVHGSALPKGQGWSPMTWQILEGASSIPITLFEAVADLDAGSIYLQQEIALHGQELAEEWRVLLAQVTLKLCLSWFDRYQDVVSAAQPQYGKASHYRRRRPADSQLDSDRSIAEQFNLLRVVDNESYPAFFFWGNQRYDLLIRRA